MDAQPPGATGETSGRADDSAVSQTSRGRSRPGRPAAAGSAAAPRPEGPVTTPVGRDGGTGRTPPRRAGGSRGRARTAPSCRGPDPDRYGRYGEGQSGEEEELCFGHGAPRLGGGLSLRSGSSSVASLARRPQNRGPLSRIEGNAERGAKLRKRQRSNSAQTDVPSMSACSGEFYGAPAPHAVHALLPPARSAGRDPDHRRARGAVSGGRRRTTAPLAVPPSTEAAGAELTADRLLNAAGRTAAERAGLGGGRARAVRAGTTGRSAPPAGRSRRWGRSRTGSALRDQPSTCAVEQRAAQPH